MPSHRSTEKSLRKNIKRNQRNRSEISTIRTLTKRVRTAIEQKDPEQATSSLKKAVSALDKAAKKHVIHPRQAARRKSRLMHLVNKIEKSGTTAAE